MVRVDHHIFVPWLVLMLLLAAGLLPGCGIVPRADGGVPEAQPAPPVRECAPQGSGLSLQSQNRDYADRAVNDLRRLTAREQAIERLEQSVQAYQDDRERLAAAYEQLTASLDQRPESSRPRADRKRQGGLTPQGGSEPSGPERPSPKGITSMDDEDTSR